MGLPAPEVDQLWESFHQVVNMSSRELRDWLASEPAQEVPELLPDDPDARETGLGAETYGDDRWRRELMMVGHDPLKAR